MEKIQNIMTRAQSLRRETALNSITPERAGGIMYDTLAYLNQQVVWGANPMLISKLYASVSAMNEDANPISDLTGNALKPGQIVAIVPSDPTAADAGAVYRYLSAGEWEYVATIGDLPALYARFDAQDAEIDRRMDAQDAEIDSRMDAQDSDIAQFKEAVQDQVDNYPMVTINGNVSNAPDEEDITTNASNRLKFANRSALYGKGYVILRRNATFASQVTLQNTIYEIRYDFDLGGETLAVPSGCVLRFAGGKIANGTLTGDDTAIDSPLVKIFSGVTLAGSFRGDIHSAWFIDGTDPETNNAILAIIVSSLDALANPTFIIDEDIYFSAPVIFGSTCNIVCVGRFIYSGAINAHAITIGSSGVLTERKRYVLKIEQTTNASPVLGAPPENYGITIINARKCEIHIDDVSGFAYGTALVGETKGCAYNTVYLDEFGKYFYCALLLKSHGTGGFVNENLFIGGMLHVYSDAPFKSDNIGIYLDGQANGVNGNVFLKTCIESAVVGIKLYHAALNSFLWMRDEAVGTILSGDNTMETGRNFYLSGYSESAESPYNNNLINRTRSGRLGERLVASLQFKLYTGETYRGANNVLTSFFRTTYNTNIAASSNLDAIYIGAFLDTSEVKDFRVEFDQPGRYLVRMYDSNGELLDNDYAGEHAYTEFNQAINASYKYQFSMGTNKSSALIQFKDEVKKVFIGGRVDLAREMRIYTKSIKGIQAQFNGRTEVQDLPVSVNDMVVVGDMVFYNGKPLFVSAISADHSVTMVDATGAVVSS